MRISDWSSDVCSSDLIVGIRPGRRTENESGGAGDEAFLDYGFHLEISSFLLRAGARIAALQHGAVGCGECCGFTLHFTGHVQRRGGAQDRTVVTGGKAHDDVARRIAGKHLERKSKRLGKECVSTCR